MVWVAQQWVWVVVASKSSTVLPCTRGGTLFFFNLYIDYILHTPANRHTHILTWPVFLWMCCIINNSFWIFYQKFYIISVPISENSPWNLTWPYKQCCNVSLQRCYYLPADIQNAIHFLNNWTDFYTRCSAVSLRLFQLSHSFESKCYAGHFAEDRPRDRPLWCLKASCKNFSWSRPSLSRLKLGLIPSCQQLCRKRRAVATSYCRRWGSHNDPPWLLQGFAHIKANTPPPKMGARYRVGLTAVRKHDARLNIPTTIHNNSQADGIL